MRGVMRKKIKSKPKPKAKAVKAKAKGAKASDKSGQASRGAKAITVAPKREVKVKPMWKKKTRARKPAEVKPEPVMAPEGRYSDKPTEAPKPESWPTQTTNIESWRCVWCGFVNTVDVHACTQCGQFR
jgi:hypothetical protein